jgi:exodeoxyribonuclease VII large subunit
MDQAVSLSFFLYEVRQCVAEQFGGTHRVVAEIAAMQGSKHLYMELIEKQGGETKAKVRANLWAYNRYRVLGHFEHVTRESLKPGMKVLLEVEVEFHLQYGFSFTVVNIDPAYTLGEFERQKQQAIARLREEGWLEANKHLPLPRVIKRVAVLTSATAAGYQDFQRQIAENAAGYAFDLVLFSCPVQGEKAPQGIMEALDLMERDSAGFDVVVLIRGGGSVIDLSCFDNYALNRAMAQSSYPVITGIGHDRDQCVADLVAHTALKTPTAVAEMIIGHNALFERDMLELGNEIAARATDMLGEEMIGLQHMALKIKPVVQGLAHTRHMLLQGQGGKVKQWAMALLAAQGHRVDKAAHRIRHVVALGLQSEREKLERRQIQLQALEPSRWLSRGYTISMVNNLPIGSQALALGDELTTISQHYRITSKITHIE